MIGVYLRSSTNKQDKGLDAQKQALKRLIESKGIKWHEIRIYQDTGISGAKAARPGLLDLLSDVQEKRLEKVYCYSFSRISRSIRDLIEIVDIFERYSVEFHSYTENVDTSTPMGRCFLNIIASLNQAEREILQERTRNGLKAAKARGSRLGRPKQRNSKLIQELFLKGYSYREIANLANCSLGTVSNELSAVHKKAA